MLKTARRDCPSLARKQTKVTLAQQSTRRIKMFTTKLAASMMLIILALSCYAQEKPQEKPDAKRISVALSVSAKDEFRGEVISYFTRALREFKDIDIVEELPPIHHIGSCNFKISVVVIKDKTVSGRDIGYSMATIISTDIQYTTYFVETHLVRDNPESLRSPYLDLKRGLRDFEHMVHFSLTTGSDLRKIIEKEIAAIDGTIFEAARK